MDAGICYIKESFLNNLSKDEAIITNQENDDNSEPPKKISRFEKGKHKLRGQNKSRPIFKEDRSLSLCRIKLNGPSNVECSYKNCIYMHDIADYLKKKPQDLDGPCYVYSVKGFCARGLTCRFANQHIDEKFNNLKSEIYNENTKSTYSNGIPMDLKFRLQKFDYDFSHTTQLVKKYEKLRNERKEQIDNKTIGSIEFSEEEIKGRDVIKQKRVEFRNKIILSPLTTVGNLPFRRICKEFGADITCGEMACAVPIVKGMPQEWALTKRHESEDIFGVQICGNSAQLITQAAQLIHDNLKIDYIDLNIGCPIDLIYQQGGGSALMRRPKVLEIVTKSCNEILGDIPFTVKMRTGVYADKSVAHELVPALEEWGATAITLHGRSKEQRYTKNANWEYIEECASKAKNMAIIGNGDIMNFEDYNEKRTLAPHVSSVMIGRGALIKPWIFKEIKEQKHLDPSCTERFEMLQKYVNYGLEHWGSDIKGVETTRRFLLEWISFLYRYVPYGLLVNPPQKINQRPQRYHGRDEMETLMCSPNSSDWIKLSEKLLGPVPQNFSFLPKHKANSYM